MGFKIQDLSLWLNRMASCNTLKEWLDLSNDMMKFLNESIWFFETEGIASLYKGSNPNANLSSLKLLTITELFIREDFESNFKKLLFIKDSTRKLINSLTNKSSLVLSFESDGDIINIKFRVIPCDNENFQILKNNIQAHFPGSTILEKEELPNTYMGSVYGGGVPPDITESSQFLFIDEFLMSMYGNCFEYSIILIPCQIKDINNLIIVLQEILDKTHTINQLNIQTGTAKGFTGVLSINLSRDSGRYLINLISNDLQRCKEGFKNGMWLTLIKLSYNDTNTKNKLESIFPSIFGKTQVNSMMIQTRETPFFTLLNGKEISSFFSIPSQELPGIALKKIYNFGNNYIKGNGLQVSLGKILNNMQHTNNRYEIELNSLTKHTFITGVTGSGKTNTVKKILSELNKHNIPYLVIEPVKEEYKLPGVNYIDVGKDSFSVNLFKPAVHETDIITHIDYLRAVFAASFVLYPPMPYVLESSIYKVYSKLGFKFDDKDKYCKNYPTINDLIFSIEEVIKEAGYTSRLKDDILASLKVRLQNLLFGFKGNIFNSQINIPSFQEIMTTPTVLNLNRIVDDEQKALLISIIITYLYEYREKTGPSTDLKHVTIIEEAHRLLSKSSYNEINEQPSPRSKAVEFFANLLSEIRSYGEGLIIAEQIPSKLITDVIKNTNTKISHKIVSCDDKLIMGKSMNFEEKYENFLSILKQGQAVIFSDNTTKPIIVQIDKT